jgi:hypothetical protein
VGHKLAFASFDVLPIADATSNRRVIDLLNQGRSVFLTSTRRFNRLCLAKRLKLRDGGPPELVNRLRISLENARARMAHYLGNKEGRNTRCGETAGKSVP